MFVVLQHCNEEECWRMLRRRRRNIKMPAAGSARYWMGNESIMARAHSKQVMINVTWVVFAHVSWLSMCGVRIQINKQQDICIQTHSHKQICLVLYSYSSVEALHPHLCTHTRTQSHMHTYTQKPFTTISAKRLYFMRGNGPVLTSWIRMLNNASLVSVFSDNCRFSVSVEPVRLSSPASETTGGHELKA